MEAGYDHVHQKPYASDHTVDGEIAGVTMKQVELDGIVVCGIWWVKDEGRGDGVYDLPSENGGVYS